MLPCTVRDRPGTTVLSGAGAGTARAAAKPQAAWPPTRKAQAEGALEPGGTHSPGLQPQSHCPAPHRPQMVALQTRLRGHRNLSESPVARRGQGGHACSQTPSSGNACTHYPI